MLSTSCFKLMVDNVDNSVHTWHLCWKYGFLLVKLNMAPENGLWISCDVVSSRLTNTTFEQVIRLSLLNIECLFSFSHALVRASRSCVKHIAALSGNRLNQGIVKTVFEKFFTAFLLLSRYQRKRIQCFPHFLNNLLKTADFQSGFMILEQSGHGFRYFMGTPARPGCRWPITSHTLNLRSRIPPP